MPLLGIPAPAALVNPFTSPASQANYPVSSYPELSLEGTIPHQTLVALLQQLLQGFLIQLLQ